MHTLAELKAENAAEELKKPEAPAEESTSDEPVLDLTPEKQDESEGDEQTESAEVDPELFKPEEDETESDSGKAKFSDSDAAAIRRKYKGKLSEKDQENEKLRLELDDIKKRINTPHQALAPVGEPQREAYANDAEWLRALTAYNVQAVRQQSDLERQNEDNRRKREELSSKTQAQVDQHYTRVAELARKSNISDDIARSADLKVRNAVDAVYKGAGDTIVDTLISNLGAGSEKVILHLGIKTSKLNELVNLFRDDPSGLKAAAYLGSLKAELNAPMRKETSAPAPLDKIQGDKSGGGNSADKLRKQANDARKKGDISEAIAAKRHAKSIGIDTSKW